MGVQMENKGKRMRLFMGLAALAAFFLFQGSTPVHTKACFNSCGADLPEQGSLKVYNMTNNHIMVVLVPIDEKGKGDSFMVRSPIQYPQESIAIKLMVVGRYDVIVFLISAIDKNKMKLVLDEWRQISYDKQAEVKVVSNEIF
jgi:hypothetical protein